MQRNGLSQHNLLIKPTSGTDGNLGFNVPEDQLQWSYKQQDLKKTSGWPNLYSFTQGISGGGNETRSKFVFDYIELSQVGPFLRQDLCMYLLLVLYGRSTVHAVQALTFFDTKMAVIDVICTHADER